MRNIRIRTLMIAVAFVAFLLGSVGPAQQWYRRWAYHRSQAAWYGRMEQQERLCAINEAKLASNLDAIRASLMNSSEFAGKSPEELETAVNATVQFHKLLSEQSRHAAADWEEKRRLEETAAFWCWDPFAPDVP